MIPLADRVRSGWHTGQTTTPVQHLGLNPADADRLPRRPRGPDATTLGSVRQQAVRPMRPHRPITHRMEGPQ